MTIRDLERRARQLSQGQTWLVEVLTADGSYREMPMTDLLKMYERGELTRGISFRTVCGSNMKQLNTFLDAIGGCI